MQAGRIPTNQLRSHGELYRHSDLQHKNGDRNSRKHQGSPYRRARGIRQCDNASKTLNKIQTATWALIN